MHVSAPTTCSVSDDPEAEGLHLQGDLVSFERPEGDSPPVVEIGVAHRGESPDLALTISTTTELDKILSDLTEALQVLREWRKYLPQET
jgi:hypothetical protein